MDSGSKIPITFQIFKGNTLVRTETLTQDIIKVGKLASSHLASKTRTCRVCTR